VSFGPDLTSPDRPSMSLLIVGNSEQLPAGDFTLAQTEAYRAILRKGI